MSQTALQQYYNMYDFCIRVMCALICQVLYVLDPIDMLAILSVNSLSIDFPEMYHIKIYCMYIDIINMNKRQGI